MLAADHADADDGAAQGLAAAHSLRLRDGQQAARGAHEHGVDRLLVQAVGRAQARHDALEHVVVPVPAEAVEEVLAVHVLREHELLLVAAAGELDQRGHLGHVAERAPGRVEVAALVAEGVEARDHTPLQHRLVVVEVLDLVEVGERDAAQVGALGLQHVQDLQHDPDPPRRVAVDVDRQPGAAGHAGAGAQHALLVGVQLGRGAELADQPGPDVGALQAVLDLAQEAGLQVVHGGARHPLGVARLRVDPAAGHHVQVDVLGQPAHGLRRRREAVVGHLHEAGAAGPLEPAHLVDDQVVVGLGVLAEVVAHRAPAPARGAQLRATWAARRPPDRAGRRGPSGRGCP